MKQRMSITLMTLTLTIGLVMWSQAGRRVEAMDDAAAFHPTVTGQAKLAASGANAFDSFGAPEAVSDQTAVGGSPLDSDAGEGSGSAYSSHQEQAQVSADLTLRRGVEAHFAWQDACDQTNVDVSVTEQKDKAVPGSTTMLRRAVITLTKIPVSNTGGCAGVDVHATGTITNPTFTLDPFLNRARLTGSASLVDTVAIGTSLPVTFDVSWMGVGPLAPSLHIERQDLGDSIAIVFFFGVQRPAIAAGTLFSGGVNQIPTASSGTDNRLFKDLNATATIQKK